MPTTSIKISQLDPIPNLTGSDFFPIDQSSSIKTYRASLTQLQDLFSTGSFTGSLTGRITGTGTSPQFVGTSSWSNNSISSSYSLSSSYADFARSSSYALSSSNSLTASYALNANSAGDIFGSGTTNYLPIWTAAKTLGNSGIYYNSLLGNVSSYNFYVSKNTPAFIATGSGQSFLAAISDYNSTLILANSVTSSDAHYWVVTGDNGASAAGYLGLRGGFDWTVPTSSNNFTYNGAGSVSPKDYTADGLQGGIMRLLRIRNNGFYLWPLSSVQSVSKDGTFNIGVDSATENHETRFKIQVYSGSSASPTIDHLQKAIEVTYGSGSSYPVTFCVSSSGQVYSTGYNVISSSNFAYTSSLKSGHFSVIEDNGVMYLFARSANGTLRSASLA